MSDDVPEWMGGERRRGRGRPRYEPTDDDRALVSRLAGLLVSQREIAANWIKPAISINTLQRHFRKELDNGPEATGARLKALLLRSAENGSVRAMTYLIDRICPEIAPKFRLPDPEDIAAMPAGTTVIIRGGLPARPDDQWRIDGAAKPNGHAGNGSDHADNGGC